MSPPQITPFDPAPTEIDGLWIIQVKQITDERGTIREFFRASALREAGLPDLEPWAQINVTETRRGAIRGLHGESMHKLVGIVEGEAFGAYVDARPGSPTRGKVVTTTLTKGTQVLVPEGVCNGFQSVSPGGTQYLYCFDHEWQPGMAGPAVHPLDPDLAIPWPVAVDPSDPAFLSLKDHGLPLFRDLPGG